MDSVLSKDGTTIAYDRKGSGPAVIFVTGGLDDGTENVPLAGVLSRDFTTYNYQRRGRGESGDTPPYAVEREIEDIEALVAAAGGSAHLVGVSSGGALALEAAAAGVAVDRIGVYEIPYLPDEAIRQTWLEYGRNLAVALAADRRDEALELFMRLAGSSDDDIAGARRSHLWPGLLELAPTLAYDGACLRDGAPQTDRFAALTQPVLVATGDAGTDFFGPAADALAAAIPRAERRIFEGFSHVPTPEVFGAALAAYFTTQSPVRPHGMSTIDP